MDADRTHERWTRTERPLSGRGRQAHARRGAGARWPGPRDAVRAVTSRPVVGLLALAFTACTGYSASHGPRPVEPGHAVFSAGLSVITDSGEGGMAGVMPEMSYRVGLTDRVDAGLEWAGVSIMVDGLATVLEHGDRVLSAGLGISTSVGSFYPVLHPEVYYGSEALFVAVRPMILLADPGIDDDDTDLPVAGVWPGVSLGTTLGRPECTHVLPTVSAFVDETVALVLTLNLRLPRGYDCD